MNYLEMSQFAGAWYFQDPDIGLSTEDIAYVRPLAAESANRVWNKCISSRNTHPAVLDVDEWPNLGATWESSFDWQTEWNGIDTSDLKRQCSFVRNSLASVPWQSGDCVLFAWSRDCIVETSWAHFLVHWVNFLFDSEGPLLFSLDSPTVVQFQESGIARIGKRPNSTDSELASE